MRFRNAVVVALVAFCCSCAAEGARYQTSDQFRRAFRKTGCPALVKWEPIEVNRGTAIRGFESCVAIEYWIGADGVPGQFKIREANPPDAFADRAVYALEVWRFEPAARPTHVIQKLHFTTDRLLLDPHTLNDDFLCGSAVDQNPSWTFCGPEDTPDERK